MIIGFAARVKPCPAGTHLHIAPAFLASLAGWVNSVYTTNLSANKWTRPKRALVESIFHFQEDCASVHDRPSQLPVIGIRQIEKSPQRDFTMSLRKFRKRISGTATAQPTETLKTSPGSGGSKDDSTSSAHNASRSTTKRLFAPKENVEGPSQRVTNAMVRELRELIRYRYELDCKIWDRRAVKVFMRDSVEADMSKADAAMVAIKKILESWDRPEKFSTREEYQKFTEIKARITRSEIRNWTSNPPWSEEGRVAMDGGYYHSNHQTISKYSDLWALQPKTSPQEPTSQGQTVLTNRVHLDRWPELPDERLRRIERDPPLEFYLGKPESPMKINSEPLDHTRELELTEPDTSMKPNKENEVQFEISFGPDDKSPEVSSESVMEVREEYSRRDRAPPDHAPDPILKEPDDLDPLSDTEEIDFPLEKNDRQPAFVVAILNIIVTDFDLDQLLQDLLQQASNILPYEKLFDFFRDILQRYHEDLVSDTSVRVKPQLREVLGIGKYRDIIARRVLDDHILAGLSSDDETSELASVKTTTKLEALSKLNNFSHINPESCAFRNMLNSIRELLLPTDLLEDLLPIPRHHITYETSREATVLERFQRRFEGFTDLEWDWWPLSDSMRLLSSDEARVLWRCVSWWAQLQHPIGLIEMKSCGITRWRDLHLGQQELLREVLASRLVKPEASHSCLVTEEPKHRLSIPFRTALGSGSNIGRITPQARSSTSSAQSRYTPTGVSSKVAGNATGGTNTINVAGGSNIGTSAGNPTSANSIPVPKKQMWIIFGVEGPLEPLELSQMNNDYLHNDQVFIRELRQRHWKLRGWLRILFSIWRLRYWEFVKVSISFLPSP